jgi:hypothetical protein
MAEAGALAEFLDWLRRKPKFSIPSGKPAMSLTWLSGENTGLSSKIYVFEQSWTDIVPPSLDPESFGGTIGRAFGFQWDDEVDVTTHCANYQRPTNILG